ncbi:hypothetical protein ACP70R_024345 [Stipagrostis hirtigluma subsp. patula]
MAARAGALLVVTAVALLVASASAQSGCTTALIGMYSCLNYISGNASSPPASCCSQLKSVVQSQPECLCAALSGDSSSLGGVTIDKDRALKLPQACNVVTPPASKCNTAGGGNAPGAATPTTPSTGTPANAGTGVGSKTTPFLTSGGASLRESLALVLGFAAVVVYAAMAV